MIRKVFLAYVVKNYSPPVKGSSGWETEEEELFNLIKNSPHQQRNNMIRNSLLDLAAQIKAEDMVLNNYFDHISPKGVGPNDIVRSVGYKLPSYYPSGRNNVESLAIGGKTPAITVQSWYDSEKHRDQVFGHNKFFKDQECIGIARRRGQDGRILSVFLSAPCI